MAKRQTAKTVQVGMFKTLSYRELKPNPQNPRRLFDRGPLEVLRDSIRANGILVPLTVYQEKRTRQHYILDGERRWRCAELIESDPKAPREVPIPANVVKPPEPVANLLWMFNIHNLREQWELMPTALSLEALMKELGETSDARLAELTKVSEPQIKRCKLLLSYHKKYQQRMMDIDPERRIRANFFIELHPVLDLYMKLPKRWRAGKSRDELIDHFLALYEKGNISSVIHFRRILEAHDLLSVDGEVDEHHKERFLDALRTLAASTDRTIRSLFDPLTKEEKSLDSAQKACQEFLRRMRWLKIEHVVKRSSIRKSLLAVQKYVSDLLTKLEG